ncbi:hypothetical protein A2U01_0035995, partial [Trifolium medium]|nr:hypothetical protein [Trifolium medium]
KSQVLNCPDRRCSLSERVANSSPQPAAARHEQVSHWCGSLKLAEPSLSEQLAIAR